MICEVVDKQAKPRWLQYFGSGYLKVQQSCAVQVIAIARNERTGVDLIKSCMLSYKKRVQD